MNPAVMILSAVCAIEAVVICFCFYVFNRIFEVSRDQEPLEPIEWEDWYDDKE